MKTLVIASRRADAPAEAFERLGELEVQAVWRGIAAGTVRAVHGLVDGLGAALELETTTEADAHAYIDSLPFVVENLLDVQIVTLKPFPPFAELAR